VQAKHEGVKSTEAQYNSALDGIKQILKEEGFAGLYAGLPSSLLGTASTNFAYFYAYSFLRNNYNKRYNPNGGTLSTALELLLGAAAGAITTLITTPVSVVTTRQQTLPASERQNVIETTRSIVAEEGVQGLWRGVKPSLVLCVNPAITYASFEKFKEFVLSSLDKKALTPGLAFFVGALSKTLATVITYPYIMAKVRLQWKAPKEMEGKIQAYTGSFDVLGRVLKSEGFFGWYKVRIPFFPRVSDHVTR
jgi:adenine nucleotide transporter 17